MHRSTFLKLAATTAVATGTRLAFPWAASAANTPVKFAGALYRIGGKGKVETSTDVGRTWKPHSNIGGTNTITKLAVRNNRLYLTARYTGRPFTLVLSKDKRSWLSR
jgi:hypothetical protein